jgi:hypothetical protein
VTFGRRHASRSLPDGFGLRSLMRAWLGGSVEFVGGVGRDGFAEATGLARLIRSLPRRDAAVIAVIVVAAGAVPLLSLLTAFGVFNGTPVLQRALEQPLLLCGGAVLVSVLGVLALEPPRGRSLREYLDQLAARLHSLRANSGAATRRSTDEGAPP